MIGRPVHVREKPVEATPQEALLLFSPRMVGVCALLGGFPAGFALTLTNLKRVGDMYAYRRMWWYWGGCTLVALAVSFIIDPQYLLMVNLLIAAYFYSITNDVVRLPLQNGRTYLPDTALMAVGLGFAAWAAWSILFVILRMGIGFILAMYYLSFLY